MESTPLLLTIKERWGKGLGLAFGLSCALLGSFKGLAVSEVKNIGPIQIFGLRSLGAVIFLTPLMMYKRHSLVYDCYTNIRLTVRSLVGNVAVLGYYYGLVYLPLADASLIFYSMPIYTMCFGSFFLKERCGVMEVISVILCFTGVGFVSSPSLFSESEGSPVDHYIVGIFGALAGAVAQSVALISTRQLSSVPALVVSFWWSGVGCVACIGLPLMTGSLKLWSCRVEGILIVLVGLLGVLSELTLVLALYLQEAGKISVLLTSEILWVFLLQSCIQKEIPVLTSWIGGAMILISLLISGSEKPVSLEELFNRYWKSKAELPVKYRSVNSTEKNGEDFKYD